MAEFQRFSQLALDFADHADFLCIYIEEAHAADGFSFKNNYDIPAHKTIQAKLETARRLHNMTSSVVPLVVDKLDNSANKAYGGLFERLHIALNGKMVYIGGQGPLYYYQNEVKEWLEKYVNKSW